MSKPINPALIGSFTLGALLLFIVGILVFGGGEMLNTDKAKFVVFFDSSLNGLEVGAPVKMQGVKIGTVTDVALQFEPKSNKVYKPVVVEIDRNSLTGSSGENMTGVMNHQQQLLNRDRLVAVGFRARLETQSLLTGLLYVDLDVHPDKQPIFVGLEYHNLVEIPGIPTTTDEIRSAAEEVVKKIHELPLEEMVRDFAATLREVKNLVASDDVKKSKAALANTLDKLEQTVTLLNKNLEPLLKTTNQTLASTNSLVQDSRTMMQSVHQDLKPVLVSADKTLSAATVALEKTQASMNQLGHAVGPESTLSDTLQALQQAARSIRDLTDYLERHPEAVLSGKQP